MLLSLGVFLLVSVRKLLILECLVRKRQVRGFRWFENQAFTFVNNYFQNKSNSLSRWNGKEIGVFWQALISPAPQLSLQLKSKLKIFLMSVS